MERFRLALAILAVLGSGATGALIVAYTHREHRGAALPAMKQAYTATPERTQLYRSGTGGDAILYRVVDMPAEGLRCVMLVGNGRFGRAVSCTPLNALEGR